MTVCGQTFHTVGKPILEILYALNFRMKSITKGPGRELSRGNQNSLKGINYQNIKEK